jgi:hypothetical protein
MIKILVTTGPWYKPEWTENVLAIDKYVNDENYEMSHFKKTCPNPHSGENVHSQPIEGAILDPLTKKGLYVTTSEYELMFQFTDTFDRVVMTPHQLKPDILEKYKGYIAGATYKL